MSKTSGVSNVAKAVIVVLFALSVLVLASRGSLYGHGSLHGRWVSFVTIDADPDWSPDGRWIAFDSSRWFGGICLIEPDATGLRQIFRGNASNVDWSPDGRSIAFQGRNGIYVMSRTGGKARRILRGARFSLPAWAPDGRQLAVVEELPDLSEAIDVVKANGRGLHRLLPPYVQRSDPSWSFVAASETEPSWSPDGRQIVVQAGDGRIVAVDIASAHRRTIAEGGYEPSWSPSGRLIAFQSNSGLWVANADGSGGLRELAENGGDPSWRPDGHRLVFEATYWRGRYTRRPQGLTVVNAAGLALRKLTFGGSVDDDPSWRGDPLFN
jgi:Tol biopolymer transport system component